MGKQRPPWPGRIIKRRDPTPRSKPRRAKPPQPHVCSSSLFVIMDVPFFFWTILYYWRGGLGRTPLPIQSFLFATRWCSAWAILDMLSNPHFLICLSIVCSFFKQACVLLFALVLHGALFSHWAYQHPLSGNGVGVCQQAQHGLSSTYGLPKCQKRI
jgi:hypothetical protein